MCVCVFFWGGKTWPKLLLAGSLRKKTLSDIKEWQPMK